MTLQNILSRGKERKSSFFLAQVIALVPHCSRMRESFATLKTAARSAGVSGNRFCIIWQRPSELLLPTPQGGEVYQSQGQALLKGRCTVTPAVYSPARPKVSSGSHSQPG